MPSSKKSIPFFHTKAADEVFQILESQREGLSLDVAAERLARNGANRLPKPKRDNILIVFLRQFQSSLIAVLLAAAVVVFLMGETMDGLVIMVVLVLNAFVGTFQEERVADRLSALAELTKTSAEVLRGGDPRVISDEDVVLGDVVILTEGAKVPADARLFSVNNLSVDEAALTGESEPVRKITDIIASPQVSVADRRNMVFRGTYVVGGTGMAVVSATGLDTSIGSLAKRLLSIDSEAPLKANIRALSSLIMAAIALIVVVLFFLGLARGYEIQEMFRIAVAVAVSAIPEGLPIVVTLILATGVWRMSTKNVLVKRLQAVEALGQAKVIAVDKTGTITKNQMMVHTLYLDGKRFEVSGSGYEPKGTLEHGGATVEPINHPTMVFSGKISLLTSSATIAFDEKNKSWKRVAGEPTEAALSAFAGKIGFERETLLADYPQVAEIPFDSRIKYHATVNTIEGKNAFLVAGAPEVILENSRRIMMDGQVRELSAKGKKELERELQFLSSDGLRVLALATALDFSGEVDPANLPPLCFVAFAGIRDVIREEVVSAVEKVRRAGMRVVMITGDYVETARAIGRKVGIWKDGDEVLTGAEIEGLSADKLAARLGSVSIFARVSPEHKLKIIEGYRKRKEIVAMTGDGVNDALSLAAADLGVAMGRSGTEVAKQAADVVLLDDNFGSIVDAIEEGRNIYKTIEQVLIYLFSTGVGELLAISAALFMGLPIPLTPSQIIWLNLVTDSFLVLALALPPKAGGLADGQFHKPSKYIITRRSAPRIILLGGTMMAITMFLFLDYYKTDFVKATTVALTALAVMQWLNAWNVNSKSRSVFSAEAFKNKFLWFALGIVIFLQLAVVYTPFMQNVFHTSPLTLSEWGLIVGLSFSIILVEEVRKFFYRLRHKSR
ncbi:MAG: HAD-IC family P-type ATPase [bacterium]|nr:HAD-IC family P-type ATPase [bacterium]